MQKPVRRKFFPRRKLERVFFALITGLTGILVAPEFLELIRVLVVLLRS